MDVFRKYEMNSRRIYLPFLSCMAMILLLTMSIVMPDAQASQTTEWYRLRTNSVPYQPDKVAVDNSGGVWVSAQDGTEYAPGVWYRPPGASAAPAFRYITNDRRNNLLEAAYNPPIEKPQLSASVLYAVKDKGGNTWYALNNRTVLCQKDDNSWLTFNMPDSSSIQPGVDTTNVDSAFRIRLIDKPDGSQEKLLIAARGVIRVNAAFTVVETRQVYYSYNNYFIRDVLVDSHGSYWVTSEMGLEKGTSLVNTTYVKDLFPVATYPSAPAEGAMITRIVEDSLGNIWFGSDFGYGVDGIYCYTAGGQWNKYTSGAVSDFGLRVHDIAAGSDGSVWFGGVYSGAGGILRYVPTSGGQWTRYTQADLGLESGEVPSLDFDASGLWFVTAYNPSIPGNGTGVHYLTFTAQGQPSVVHYTYRSNSTSLTNLRFNQIAADKSGGVWFPAYDDTSIARLKADGSWQQFRQAGSAGLGSFGVVGAAADSQNIVYFAPLRSEPVAYNVTTEQWLTLPAAPFSDLYYYGVYVDPQDGKWFYGAYGVYYLNPANSAWTSFSPAEIPGFPASYYVNDVMVDDAGNTWFMCRYEVILMKKKLAGGDPSWFRFTSGSDGYIGGYNVFQDDSGQVWNASKQKFDSVNNVWLPVPADTSALDHRHLRFLNGTVPADMDVSGGLTPISTISALDENNMTMDSRGTILFSGGLGTVSTGIVAYGPLLRELQSVTVNAADSGAGSVNSSPAGISYSYNTASSGTSSFSYGSTVVLTATAAAGSTAVWTDCTTNGGVVGGTTAAATCTFNSLISAKTVSASFVKSRFVIDVNVSGTGTGTVTSSSATVGVPADIVCTTGVCSAEYPNGSTVNLIATPSIYTVFSGWSGVCTTTSNSCIVTMNSDKTLNATFMPAPKVKVGSKPFSAVQAAYSDAETLNNAVIKMLEGTLTGSFTSNRNILVTLEGGYNAVYGAISGQTAIQGAITLGSGAVRMNGIVIK